MMGDRWLSRAMATALAFTAWAAAPVWAAPSIASARMELTADVGVETDGDGLAKHRLTAAPQARIRFSRNAYLKLLGRVEIANDDTGLGDVSGYSDISAPLIDDDTLRVELDEAALNLKRGRTRWTFGKQIVAWGALDGVRVTDAFNPIRLREGVAIPHRPDRIGLWGARARFPVGRARVDIAIAPDATVNQSAEPGDAFFPTAPRFLGGLPAGTPTPPLVREDRDDIANDIVWGARIGADIAGVETHAVVISGPQQDPLLRPQAPTPDAPPTALPTAPPTEIALAHERRTLFGVDAVKTLGPVIARVEAAVTPHELFNTVDLGGGAPRWGEVARARWLAGVGVDWSAPRDVLVNAQLVVDTVEDAPANLVRPATDLIATLRAQRRFHNDATELKAEVLGSFTDGDALVRFDVSRTLNDVVRASIGADVFLGDRDGLFGQFRDASRLRIAITAAF